MSTNFNNDNRKVVHGRRSQLNIQNLIDECKTLFLTSYSTMASLLTCTMLLLAKYPEWQECVRTETWEVCGFHNDMDATKLNHMKIVSTYFYSFQMLCNLNNCCMIIYVSNDKTSIINKNWA
jgi:hypothetical protein